MYEIKAVEWVECRTSRLGGADRGAAIQRGPADGSNFDSSVPSATHYQNHFVGRGRLKFSSPSRRLLSLSVDVADAVAFALHPPWIAILP